MERATDKIIFKKNNANKYLIALVIGALLLVLSPTICVFSASIASYLKYGFFDYQEVLEEGGEKYLNLLSIVQFVQYIPIFLFFIYLLKDDLRLDFIEFKADRKRNFSIILIGLGSILVLTMGMSLLYDKLGIEESPDNQELIESVLSSSGGIFMGIGTVLLAPFVEEMIFRKSLCDALKYKFRVPDIVIIILSAVIFSLMHVSGIKDMISVFRYLPLALVIVLSYYYSKNIYVPLTIHFINNLFSLVISYLYIYGGLN